MSEDIRWIRSYVLAEADGSIGTLCIYQATSEQALRDHTARADLHLDEIVEVADTVIARPDPVGATS
jgi:thiamine biosynthesis protein ThiC